MGKQKEQFLYILDCGAILHKFDVLAEKLISNTDLSQKTRLIPTHGDVTGSTIDGCAANGAAYFLQDATFTTLALTTASMDENGKQRYCLLQFHLPDLRPVRSVPVPGSYESAPKLEMSSTGTVKVITSASTFSLTDDKLTTGREEDKTFISGSRTVLGGPMLDVDVAGYDLSRLNLNSQPTHLVYVPLERSGNSVLIQFIRQGQGFAYAVVDTVAKQITELNPGFNSTADNFHLAPGGQEVLVQESLYPRGMQVAQTTDKLAIIDAKTGAVLRTWNSIVAAHASAVITITPAGAAIFFSDDRYHFVRTGSKFPDQPIYPLDDKRPSSYFYADR